MVNVIYLVRHAESEMNLVQEGVIGGQSNWAELTENGVRQSESLGRRFEREGRIFERIYSSPAIRTQQTARYCLGGNFRHLGRIVLGPELLELDQGDWEGANRNEIYERLDVKEGLKIDNWNFVPGDLIKGESQSMISRRMFSWLERVTNELPEGDIVAFTHGIAIKMLLTGLFGRDTRNAYRRPMMNTSVTAIEKDSGHYGLLRENDYKHLEEEGIRFIK